MSAEKAYGSVPNYFSLCVVEGHVEDKVISFNKQ